MYGERDVRLGRLPSSVVCSSVRVQGTKLSNQPSDRMVLGEHFAAARIGRLDV